jgi:NTE family protein
MGSRVPFEAFMVGSADKPAMAPAARAWMQWARLLAPHQLNPLGLNPLRDVLVEQIDFERLRAESKLKLFIAATHANTGRLRLFGTAELTADAVLASACLPTLQPPVMIDGEPYWDGGYSANPALFPLVRSGIADLLIVWLSPLVYARSPVSAQDIRERALDFAFNATFLREAQMLADLCASARQSAWPFGELARLRTHLIDANEALGELPQETKLMAHAPFLESLHERGRERAAVWLEHAGHRVGRASSVDLAALLAPPG